MFHVVLLSREPVTKAGGHVSPRRFFTLKSNRSSQSRTSCCLVWLTLALVALSPSGAAGAGGVSGVEAARRLRCSLGQNREHPGDISSVHPQICGYSSTACV